MRKNRYTKLLELDNSKPLKSSFKVNAYAGIYKPKDLVLLERAQQIAYASMYEREVKEHFPKDHKGEHETVYNTVRYRQVPGTATIYGGRK